MLPTKFGVNWLLGLGEEAKIDFQEGRHVPTIYVLAAIMDIR